MNVNAGLGHVLRRNKVHLHIRNLWASVLASDTRHYLREVTTERVVAHFEFGQNASNCFFFLFFAWFLFLSFESRARLLYTGSIRGVAWIDSQRLVHNYIFRSSRYASRTIIELNVLYSVSLCSRFFFSFLLLRVAWKSSGNEEKYVVRYNIV